MSTRAFRSGVVSEVVQWAAAEFPALPIIYENGPVPDEDKIGPIWRTAEDCAIVFEAIRGKDERDPTTMAAAFNYNQKIVAKELRVGYLKSDFNSDYRFKKQDSLVLAKLRELGITPIAIELPPVPDIGFVLSAEAAAAFDELARSGQDDLLVRQIRNA